MTTRVSNFWRSLSTEHQMMLGICAGLTLALVLFTIDAYHKGKRTDERKRRKYHKIKRQVERQERAARRCADEERELQQLNRKATHGKAD
jgi:mannose/fructose-specific phosphotransferase system component IIA